MPTRIFRGNRQEQPRPGRPLVTVPDQLTLDWSAIWAMKPRSPAAHASPQTPPPVTSAAARDSVLLAVITITGSARPSRWELRVPPW